MIAVFGDSLRMSAMLESDCEREIVIGSDVINAAMGSWKLAELPHLRSSALFGWLCGRSQRSFRTFIYYAYRYWLSLRQAKVAGPDVNSFVRTAITAYATAPHTSASAEEFALATFTRLISSEARILGLNDRANVRAAEQAFRLGFRLATRQDELPTSQAGVSSCAAAGC
jgi:hypothetical protein